MSATQVSTTGGDQSAQAVAVTRQKCRIMRQWVEDFSEITTAKSHVVDEDLQEISLRVRELSASGSKNPERLCQANMYIGEARALPSNPRTLIALLGGSGHGKSSLINALIGKNNVVTASSMRASTSVPTEAC